MRVKNFTDQIAFIEHIRRRPGDTFTFTAAMLEQRRDLFPGEKKLVEASPRAQATYEAIKDKAGKVPQLFSFRWMEVVGGAEPEKLTSAQQAVNQRSEEIKQERAASRPAAAKDVI